MSEVKHTYLCFSREVYEKLTSNKCRIDSQEFDYKTETQYLQRFKAIETSYEGYSEPIYYFR